MNGEIEPDLGPAIMNNIVEQFLNPELAQRRAAGTLPEGFVVARAQIIFKPISAPPVVRFNEEVRAVVKVRWQKTPEELEAMKGGDVVTNYDYDAIEAIELEGEDRNCGHITILPCNDEWVTHFSFIYNRGLIRQILKVVPGYVETAEFALAKGHLHSFVENLWSAAELMAKAELYAAADQKTVGTRKHGTIKAQLNLLRRGLPDLREFAQTLNRLEELRGPARYLDKKLVLTAEESRAMLETAKRQLEVLRRSVPASILEVGEDRA